MFGFVFFVAMFLIGNFVSTSLALPVPGSIVGLGMVFAIFVVRGKVDAPLKSTSDTFLQYLPLMLVPTCVGVITVINGMEVGIAWLLLALVLALVVGCFATAWIARLLFGRRDVAINPTAQSSTPGRSV